MAKKLRDEDLILNIIVNGDKGRKEMLKLQRDVKDLNSEIKSLEKEQANLRREGKKDTQEYKNLSAAIKQKAQAVELAEARIIELRKGMSLAKMSAVDLRQEMNRLKRLRDLSPYNSKQWRQFDDQLQKVKRRYGEVMGANSSTAMSLKNLAGKFNHYFGLMAAGAASVVGAIQGIRSSIEDFTILDDKMSDVQRTTGLTKKEVQELKEALSIDNFDSRTDLVELLGLGQIGGKLGQKGVENLERFVKANDALVVGLADDLGDAEIAVREIGKLVEIFNVTEDFPIDEAIIKTGSLINSLGINSTAQEARIIDFMKRTSGLSNTFNVAIENTAGLAATVDYLGNSIETAGTAYNQIIPQMFKDTKNFADIAGMSLESFTDLLNRDVNEAFIRVLEGVKGNDNSMAKLVERLGDIGIEGARVTAVITSLANNTGKLRAEQEFARKEFEKGDSVLNEYKLKNENAAAELAKARKRMQELRVELGEKLFPVMTFGTSSMSYFLKALKLLIDFGQKYGKEVIILTTLIATYNIGLKLMNYNYAQSAILIKAQIFWNKALRASTLLAAAAQALFTGNLTRATAAMRIFNQVTKLNPIMLLVSVLLAGVAALALYSKGLSAAEKAQKSLNDVELEARKNILDEKLALEEKLRVAKDETRSLMERKKAIEEIKAISPQYLNDLSLETINTEKAKQATDDYIESLLKKARIEAAQSKLRDLAERELDLETTGKGAEASIGQKFIAGALQSVSPGLAANYSAKQISKNYQEAKDTLAKERQLLLEFIDENRVPLKVVTTEPDESGSGNSNGPEDLLTPEEIKEHFNTVKRELEKGMMLITETLRKQFLAREITKQEFDERMKEYELAFMIAERAAMEKAGMDTLEIDQRINDKRYEIELYYFDKKEEINQAKIDAENRVTAEIEKAVDEQLAAMERRDAEETKLLQDRIDRLKKEKEAKEAATKAYVQSTALQIASELERVQTLEGAAVVVINAIRNEVAEVIRLAVARVTANALVKSKVPFPFNIALAGIAAAAASALFKAVIPVAQTKSQRKASEAAKVPGAEDGGYLSVVRSQDGKRFRAKDRGAARGYFNRPSLLVGEHNKEEFVANGMAVKNPTVKPVLDIIDIAQRNGSINSLNLLKMLEGSQTLRARGMEAGGYTNTPAGPAPINPEVLSMLAEMKEAIRKLNASLEKPLAVSPWSISERIKELESAKGDSLG